MTKQRKRQAAVAAVLVVVFVAANTGAWGVPAARRGAVVIYDVQDATGVFRPSTVAAQVGKGLEAEGLRALSYGELPLQDKYRINPRTKVKEPSSEALSEATRPTGAERVVFLTLTDYAYNARSGKTVIEARARGLLRKPGEEEYGPLAGAELRGELRGAPRYAASERVAQREALERLGREVGAWILKGTPSQGRPYRPPPKKPGLLQRYLIPGLAVLIVGAYYLKSRKRGASGVVSSRLPPPIPLSATTAGPGATSLTWQKPTVPSDLALQWYEIEVALDGGGFQFAEQSDASQTSTTISYGVGPGIADRADFRIRAVAKDVNDKQFVSIYAYFPTVFRLF